MAVGIPGWQTQLLGCLKCLFPGLFDASDTLLLFLDDVSLLPDVATAQTFSFGEVIAGVSRAHFDIEGVQGPTIYTGLAEVRCDTAVVPLPPGILLLGTGCLALAARRLAKTYA